MVVGDRETDEIEHFSPLKKRLQRLGSWVVRQASETDVPDTTSGFRAYNREAAIQMAVVSKYTYTLETIIQAGKLLVATDHVPIAHEPEDARVAPLPVDELLRAAQRGRRSPASTRSTSRCKVFMTLAAAARSCSRSIPLVRFVVAYIGGDGAGHVQSLIFGAVLFNAAVVLAALGVIGDLLLGQRIMSQRIFEHVRRIELQLDVPPSHYEPGARADGPGAHDRRATRPRQADRGARGPQGMSSPGVTVDRTARSPATRTTSTARPTRSSAGSWRGFEGTLDELFAPGRPAARCSTSAAARAC